MSTVSEQTRREQARKAVLEFLAQRQSLKFEADMIRQRLNQMSRVDFTLDADDIEIALAFLRGCQPPLVDMIRPKRGSTQFYQATSAGVLATEQGDL